MRVRGVTRVAGKRRMGHKGDKEWSNEGGQGAWLAEEERGEAAKGQGAAPIGWHTAT